MGGASAPFQQLETIFSNVFRFVSALAPQIPKPFAIDSHLTLHRANWYRSNRLAQSVVRFWLTPFFWLVGSEWSNCRIKGFKWSLTNYISNRITRSRIRMLKISEDGPFPHKLLPRSPASRSQANWNSGDSTTCQHTSHLVAMPGVFFSLETSTRLSSSSTIQRRTTAKFSSTLSSAASPKATFTTSQLAQLDWARLTSEAVARSSSGTTVITGNQSRAGRHFEALRWTVAWRSIMGPVALCLAQGRDFSQPQNQLKMAWVSHIFFFQSLHGPTLGLKTTSCRQLVITAL